MQTLSAVIPVIGVIFLGMILRRQGWVSRQGIDDIKFVVSRIMLPVAIFNALSTTVYSARTWITVGVILVIEVATFGAGFLVKRTFHDSTAKYIPFLVSLYEGGMLAYPLYATICGQDALSNIAVIDIAGLLFGFSIWMGMLQQQESREKTSRLPYPECPAHAGLSCGALWRCHRTPWLGEGPSSCARRPDLHCL